MSGGAIKKVIPASNPVRSARIISRLREDEKERALSALEPASKTELRFLMSHEPNSAGALMDPRFVAFRPGTTVKDALKQLRKTKPKITKHICVTDSDGVLTGCIRIEDMATAGLNDTLEGLVRPLKGLALITSGREELVEQMEKYKAPDLPVVDHNGRLAGVIHYDTLIEAVREESVVDMLTMVGAGKDERALSSVSLVIRKRLPWLEVNLVTAFLAASVVGLFESTIAKFTALAVLLPVVAGQSGNTGAQTLAVTMRGLALKEIGMSQWRLVMQKEIMAGMINGVVIALTTSLGVLVWSSSYGLAFVIGVSMVIAMVAAGFAGVAIPVMLTKLGQDPAQSSSIILTTVTDCVGFFVFLGIATALSSFL